jgi:hypothetical protein
VTSTPLPQAPPQHLATPLDAERLSDIIGAPATVGASGVVAFELPQREPVILGGVWISPFLNVYTSVDFQPHGKDTAVVVPDFGMLAGQVDAVVKTMRSQGWELDCLYNQETGEQPQLYFSHNYKVGNAYRLAAEVRRDSSRPASSCTDPADPAAPPPGSRDGGMKNAQCHRGAVGPGPDVDHVADHAGER